MCSNRAEDGSPKDFEIMRVREKHRGWKSTCRSVCSLNQKLIFVFDIQRVLEQGTFGEYSWRKVESSKGLSVRGGQGLIGSGRPGICREIRTVKTRNGLSPHKMSSLRLISSAARRATRVSLARRGYADISDKLNLALTLPHKVREIP